MAKNMLIGFPAGGLDRKAAHRQNPPYATPNCVNVRPIETIENRARGGSRPGLVLGCLDDLGSEVRLLTSMTLAIDKFKIWSDTFTDTDLKDIWSEETTCGAASGVPTILSTHMASVELSDGYTAIMRDVSADTNHDQPWRFAIYIVPKDGEHHGNYYLLFRNPETDGGSTAAAITAFKLALTGSGGAWVGSLITCVESGAQQGEVLVVNKQSAGWVNIFTDGSHGSAEPGWLEWIIDGGDIAIYWRGSLIFDLSSAFISSSDVTEIGFGFECETTGQCLVDSFRNQYFTTGAVPVGRTMLVASASGNIYNETSYDRMTIVTSDLTVRDDIALTAAQSGQKLYIADYGDVRALGTNGVVSGATLDSATYADWRTLGIDTDTDVCVISAPAGSAGTYQIASDGVAEDTLTLAEEPGNNTGCTFRIERAPKAYDPDAGTLTLLTATTGEVPTGCPLTCRYLGRLVLAGAEIAPHVWYMSRQFNETDWDYSQADSQRAVAGITAEAGVPQKAMTALFTHSDDYCIMACRDQLWRMRGDPAFGGSLNALSHTVGIISQDAWCIGPSGEVVFLSLDGVYVLPPGGNSMPMSLSREKLPLEFLNLDPNNMSASLEYDVKDRGVHIFLTPDSTGTPTHWWLDWQYKGFWPVTLSSNHEPTATCTYQSSATESAGVILGGRDGFLRRYSKFAQTDDGTSFSSFIDIGPIPMGPDGAVGILASMNGVMAENSGDVIYSIHPALTFEAATSAASTSSGTWVAGFNATVRPDGKGQAYMLKIAGTPGSAWGMENVATIVRDSGPRRIA